MQNHNCGHFPSFYTSNNIQLDFETQCVHDDEALVDQFADVRIVNESESTRTDFLRGAMECLDIRFGHYCLVSGFVQISMDRADSYPSAEWLFDFRKREAKF